MVAAGGLGTRVSSWARYLPKEWLPVAGRPGIVHVLREIAEIGPARVVVVYHPYYEQFVSWARRALEPDGLTAYRRAVGNPVAVDVSPQGLVIDWVPQQGCYADLTSLLNGAEHLAGHSDTAGDDATYVVFGDNLYPSCNVLTALQRAPEGVAVLARDYEPGLAERRGVIVTAPGPQGAPRMIDLVEKPGPAAARKLQARHGTASLMLLEGRARLDDAFIAFARDRHAGARPGTEPKLALALGAYARTRPVWVVRTGSDVIDLGAPDVQHNT
ncbi:sugar phosphate nucleotidyltransferase [Nonomuraea roseoviolacea]|uniref:sugar phosphate nucleotidyltransferase n=1 Tax=Nonomuraea roseoviolacea TaxID=103837 RepID=UPI0020A59373|nr:sugar phosphate nucleotidyltransferase [Nonomuraea roseoviolacea]